MVAGAKKRCFLIVFLLTGVALGHKVEVHDLIARDAIDVASDLGIQFSLDDIERFADGSVDEDIPLRYREHHYNPHTGSGMVFLGINLRTARARASGMWTNEVLPSFTNPSNRSAGDGQGSFHYLGRVSHLLQDMAAPPHTHAPDGHGPLVNGGLDMYYSDFEVYWRDNLSLFPNVEGSDTALLASGAIPVNPTWNTKMDSYSWSEMRNRIGTQADSIEGFMDTVAWITYFHSSFYGEIDDSTTDAAPPTTSRGSGAGNTNTLDTMFGDRIRYSGDLLADWVIDGIGSYDPFDLAFNDWWPCDDDSVGSVFAGKITGRFYIYQTWGTNDWGGLSCYPSNWPDGTPNTSNTVFARYYGDVLLPLAARYNAGLLQKAFPAPALITYPPSSIGQIAVSWQAPPDSVAGPGNYYVLQRSDDGGNNWSTVYDGSTRSYTDNVGQGSYRYQVHASFGAGYSPRLYGAWRTGTYDCIVSIPPPRPTVETRPATLIIQTAAMLNGRIVDDGGSSIIERRFDWGTTPSDDGWTDWTRDVSVSGDYFWYNLTSLNPGTTYYFRAWATNRDPADPAGWGQGSILSFTTTTTQTGSLRVTISPQAAIDAGAQWRVDGGSWRNSGYTQSALSVGSHTVEFNSISVWSKPGNQSVQINSNQTTTSSGTYTQQTGSLRVTISPQAAIDAGAQWRVDGGSWRNSGYTQSGLSVGSHTVEFNSISVWSKPGEQTVQINADQTTTMTGTYTEETVDEFWKSPTATGKMSYTNEWTNPKNAFSDDTEYTTAEGTFTDQDYYNFDFNIPAGTVIDGIEVQIEGHGDANTRDSNKVKVILWSASSEDTGSKYFYFDQDTDSTELQGGPTDRWEGTNWITSDFDNNNFWLKIATWTTDKQYIDYIKVKVYYTEAPPTYAVSGYVQTSAGSGISGVTMNGLPGNPTTNGNGYYSATVDYDWLGTVTPTKAGYTFDPATRTYTNLTADQTAQNYTGTPEIVGDFCGANFGPADGYVDVWDLMQFADHWHTRTGDGGWDAKFDLAGPGFGDPDGYIDVWDLMTFADNWHEGEKP